MARTRSVSNIELDNDSREVTSARKAVGQHTRQTKHSERVVTTYTKGFRSRQHRRIATIWSVSGTDLCDQLAQFAGTRRANNKLYALGCKQQCAWSPKDCGLYLSFQFKAATAWLARRLSSQENGC